MSYTLTPHTFTVGETVTAATMNLLRDFINDVASAWDNYTPTWTASTTNPTIGNGTLIGQSLTLGTHGWALFNVKLTCGSTTTFGSGTYKFAIPGTALQDAVTPCNISDASSGSFFTGAGIITGGLAFVQMFAPGVVNNASPMAFASADRLWVGGMVQLQ